MGRLGRPLCKKVRENTWLDEVKEEGYTYPEGKWYTSNAWGRSRLKQELPNDTMLQAYLRPMWRWMVPLQNDFAARADWCVRDYAHANHQPLVRCNKRDVVAAPGAKVRLSARGTTDPDGDKLTYRWWQYAEAGTCPLNALIATPEGEQTTVNIPADAVDGQTIHIILEVRDNGTPQLTRYARTIITVRKK